MEWVDDPKTFWWVSYQLQSTLQQNPFVERIIGSIRRECLDHMIILDEQHLRRILRSYFDYYHSCRTHLSLEKDAPDSRPVEPPKMGKVVAIPKVGGLHHHYTRLAA